MTSDLYIVNYRHTNSEPLKSITALSKDEAFLIAENLYKENPCRAHNRFSPQFFPNYYQYRLETEKWLYEKFIQLGGEPKIKNPFYFVLHNCEIFYENFNNGIETKIRINDINNSDISFTFGDSMAMMDSKERKEPFTKNKLMEYIALNDGNVEKFIDSIKTQYNCIEAQLWTDKYF